MKLEYLMTFNATLKKGVPVGQGPFGFRSFSEVTGGDFEGPRLAGRLLTGGGDWVLVDEGSVSRLDVRVIMQTTDGATIYVQYLGALHKDDSVVAALTGGGSTDFGATYFMTTPRFETGDERYSWLNGKVCVAEGRIRDGGVEYRCYMLEND